jgi:nitrate reductase NapAB chaperone NapD
VSNDRFSVILYHEKKAMDIKLNTIKEAIEEIQKGRVIIVVDDEERENEGDFLTAARNVTPEIINFMATHGPYGSLKFSNLRDTIYSFS